MPSTEAEFAFRILGWILHARRILRMDELQEALAIQIDVVSLLDFLKPEATEVVRTCGGLISHDERSGFVTFSHETVRAFLENNKHVVLPSHSLLSKTCMTFLRLPEFENPPARFEWSQWRLQFAFADYAAKYWADHVAQSGREVELEAAIQETFMYQGRRDAVAELKVPVSTQGQSLLHILIENRLAFTFISPMRNSRYVSFVNSTNSKSD